MLFMPAMGKFRLHLRHIHIGRAFAFTRLAAKAELQCLFQILRPESVCFFSGEQLTEKICTATCGVLLFACCVVGGAHCSSGSCQFTAHSCTVAQIGSASCRERECGWVIRRLLNRQV